ncbi:MAG: exodeoxyribonuclease VII small subunit [Gammaproteobacteria bacterium]|nr:MAG: exodeoxyribonuclease VII small subunit [Gammaproteobacteria bacterium]
MARKKTTFSFEDSLENLETIVDQMELGELTLEESLKAFEQGIKLTRECQNALQQAEQRVQMLVEENNGEDSLVDIKDQ